MKRQEVEQVLSELKQFSRRAEAEIDTSYVRPDGQGYRVHVCWAGRVVKLSRFKEWTSLIQAWQALNERR